MKGGYIQDGRDLKAYDHAHKVDSEIRFFIWVCVAALVIGALFLV